MRNQIRAARSKPRRWQMMSAGTVCTLALTGHAASGATWDGGAGTLAWNSANNWNPNGIPTTATNVTFSGSPSAGATVSITGGDAFANALTINRISGLTIQGQTPNSLHLTTGDLTRVDVPLAIEGNTTITADIYISNHALWSVSGDGVVTVDHIYPESGTGTHTFTKTGNGVVRILTGSYPEPMTVSQGAMWLGVLIAQRGYTVASGAGLWFDVNPANPILNCPFTIAGTGVGGTGALRSLSGAVSVPGLITMTGNSQINVDAGTLTLSGGIGDGAGSFSLTKGGAGTLSLKTAFAHTYNGDTIVNAGTLDLVDSGVLPLGAGAGNVTVASGATLEMHGKGHSINGLNGSGTVTTTFGTSAFLFPGYGDADGNFSGTLTQGPGQTLSIQKNGAGVQALSGNLLHKGATQVSGGKLVLASNVLNTSSVFAQSGGTIELAAGTNVVLKTPSFLFLGGGRLDLKDNKLITSASLSTVTGMIATGRNGGAWNGVNITTSMTDATSGSGYTSLGVASASEIKGIGSGATDTWAGQTITGSDTLVMYTYGGDANLSGNVDVDDYGQIDFNAAVGGVLTGWYNGDFDYSGSVDVDDYGIIDFVINIQGPPFPTAGGIGPSVTAVPEPVGVLPGVVVAGLLRRRRREHRL